VTEILEQRWSSTIDFKIWHTTCSGYGVFAVFKKKKN